VSTLERVRSYVKSAKLDVEILEFNESTRTSQLAAQLLKCPLSQIAKSIVFNGGKPIVVVLPGDRRVNIKKLSEIVGRRVKIADPETVKKTTGYPVGGVPPFPHYEHVLVFMDKSIERFDEVWTAAGTPNTLMKVKVEDLKKASKASVVEVSE